jgi:hypothetical protein
MYICMSSAPARKSIVRVQQRIHRSFCQLSAAMPNQISTANTNMPHLGQISDSQGSEQQYVFRDVASRSLVWVYGRFRGTCWLHQQGSKHLWNVGKFHVLHCWRFLPIMMSVYVLHCLLRKYSLHKISSLSTHKIITFCRQNYSLTSEERGNQTHVVNGRLRDRYTK